jgi:C4-dicarboxylate transporter
VALSFGEEIQKHVLRMYTENCGAWRTVAGCRKNSQFTGVKRQTIPYIVSENGGNTREYAKK